MQDLREFIEAARGERDADLLLRGGRVVNVFTHEIVETAVALRGDRIVGFGERPAGEVIDVGGRYVCPGLIDAHVHIEISMLPPHRFADAVLPHGVTSVVCDPHEIANVLGLDGVRYMLDVSEGLDLSVLVMAPSCVPTSSMETSGAALGAEDLITLAEHPRVLGLAEVMNFPGVLAGSDDVLDKLHEFAGRPVDGHVPGLTGPDLQAYVGAGISSDHESVAAEEAREKLRLGMTVFLREASNARNLLALLPVIDVHTARRCAFATDDRVPGELLRDGSVDALVRLAVRGGLDPVTAITMATLNPAEHYGLRDRGAVAPGRRADLFVTSDLHTLPVELVIAGGRVVARDGRRLRDSVASPATLPDTFHVAWPPDLRLVARARRARVIGIVEDQLLTTAHVEDVRVQDGIAVADPDRDMLRLSVIERHRATGNVGMGFVRGFGLQRGAMASSVANDCHNIIVVAADDDDGLAAARAVADMAGGIAVVEGGELRAVLALPLAGLMADEAPELVADQLDAVTTAVRELGCAVPAPFMAMSFLALPVIPQLKLTDRGLVDVDTFAFTDVFVD
ncbi:adenine deaminase [Solirubrobacter ginsenosidimutans]|uniref:Adenine deaminase n=1 Tax=Solirubrobacter ginsenosidimutans TaxID=490573 RepID=A0A9X3MNM3_9ACTN|nr:adenine deaminase [Solirubrobacter ginsenosidimutans]MDA0159564.1 adenine deaminase [Solirubrobacter ginsenosidimutans]